MTARRIAMRVGVVALLGIIGYLFVISEGDNDPTPASGGAIEGQVFANEAVERFVPPAGDLAVRQDQVGVDLKPGYEAELIINDKAVPKDELTINEPLYEFFYRPAEGKAIERFAPGSTCVTAVIRDRTQPDRGPQRVSWCFQVA